MATQVSMLQYIKHYDSVGESCSDTAFTNAEL